MALYQTIFRILLDLKDFKMMDHLMKAYFHEIIDYRSKDTRWDWDLHGLNLGTMYTVYILKSTNERSRTVVCELIANWSPNR